MLQRRRVDELISTLLSLRPPVLVIPHDNADVDAVASAYGIASFLRWKGIPAVVCAPSLSAPAAQIFLRFAVEYETSCDPRGKDVVVVDTSSSSMLPVDVSSARRVVVVDHHRGGDLKGFVFDARSTSEVVARVLLFSGSHDEKALMLLAAGIISDTAGLYAADADSLSALSDILRVLGAEVSDVFDVLERPRSVSERIARLKGLRNVKIYRMGDYIVVTSSSGAYEGSVAWLLVQSGADVAFVAGKDRVSARASNRFITETGIDLTDIFSVFARTFGVSWGGHPAAAGAHVGDPEHALESLVSIAADLLKKRHRFVLRVY